MARPQWASEGLWIVHGQCKDVCLSWCDVNPSLSVQQRHAPVLPVTPQPGTSLVLLDRLPSASSELNRPRCMCSTAHDRGSFAVSVWCSLVPARSEKSYF